MSGHDRSPKMRISEFTSPWPKNRAATRMTNRNGMANSTSTTRIRTLSIQPPT